MSGSPLRLLAFGSLALCILGLGLPGQAWASWKIAPTIAFSLSKEQARDASGNPAGTFSSQRQLALMATTTYSVFPFLDLGVFAMAETGSRTLIGGGPASYNLLWVGPTVRGVWRNLFLEISYVLIGTRTDPGFGAVSSSTGDNQGAFSTDSSRAWLLTPGISLPMSDSFDVVLKLEYRFHYYDSRGGSELAGGAVVGSQSIRPHLGVQWAL